MLERFGADLKFVWYIQFYDQNIDLKIFIHMNQQ